MQLPRPTVLDGRLSLTTPEGVRLRLTPAGAVPRAWAWMIDFFLWGAFMLALSMIIGESRLAQGVYLIALFVSYWGYPILAEVYFKGKTLGKHIMGLEVVRSDGLPVGWRESSLRNLLLIADFLPFGYMTGLLFMLFDHRLRRIGDIVAGTQVIYTEKARNRMSRIDAPAQALPYPLSPEQQRVLIDLFEREADIPPARMEELGSLAQPLTGLRGKASIERLRAFAAGLTQ